MSEYVIGSVRQGTGTERLWRPGNIIDATAINTMFFASTDTELRPTLSPSLRSRLKNTGGLNIAIGEDVDNPDGMRIVTISSSDAVSAKNYQEVLRILGVNDSSNEMIETLPNGSAVSQGSLYRVGYISILAAQGDGAYKLLHDYPLQRAEGWRFEVFEDEDHGKAAA